MGENRSTQRKLTQAQGEHAHCRQVVLWLGFKMMMPGRSANHVATVLYSYCKYIWSVMSPGIPTSLFTILKKLAGIHSDIATK